MYCLCVRVLQGWSVFASGATKLASQATEVSSKFASQASEKVG